MIEIHYGIQAIDSGFRKGEWVFGTMKVPCESKEEDNSKEKDILKVTNISTMEHTDKIEGLCEDGAMHIARLLEKQGYVTTTWAGGIVSYLPGEPKATESAPMVLSAGKYLYPVFDATGTVRMWADGSGNIIARSAPGPYGEDLGYFPGPRTSMLGFAGYLGDKGGSMLWHTPNRSLTNQGRYLSVDPSGTLNLHDPRTFNQYTYVVGNPINATDPSGLLIIYGDKNISHPEAVGYYEEAKSYLSSSSVARKLFAKIESYKGDKEITLYVAGKSSSYFSPERLAIVWNPFGGVEWKGKIQSPAIVLVHEESHAEHFLDNPKQYQLDSNPELSPDAVYDNIEERKAQTTANRVAIRLKVKEPQIFTHSIGSSLVTVSGPTSNKVQGVNNNILLNNQILQKKEGSTSERR